MTLGEILDAEEIAGADPALRAALAEAGLPIDDLTEPGRRFFCFRDGAGVPVGYGGFEPLGAFALLRSLVVAKSRRDRGAGRRMMMRLLELAGATGATEVWAMSTTAVDFVLSCGFRRAERDAVPPAISRTRQYAGLCPSSAVVLCRGVKL